MVAARVVDVGGRGSDSLPIQSQHRARQAGFGHDERCYCLGPARPLRGRAGCGSAWKTRMTLVRLGQRHADPELEQRSGRERAQAAQSAACAR